MHKNVQNDYKNNIEESSNQYVPDEAKHVSRLKDTNKEKNLLHSWKQNKAPLVKRRQNRAFQK